MNTIQLLTEAREVMHYLISSDEVNWLARQQQEERINALQLQLRAEQAREQQALDLLVSIYS
jgi:hypothetical protein